MFHEERRLLSDLKNLATMLGLSVRDRQASGCAVRPCRRSALYIRVADGRRRNLRR